MCHGQKQIAFSIHEFSFVKYSWQNILLHCQLHLLLFISILLKVQLKNIKQVIPKEDMFDVIHKYHNIINNH